MRLFKIFLCSLVLNTVSGCIHVNPPPPVDRTAEYLAICSALWQSELGRPIDESAIPGCVQTLKNGATPQSIKDYLDNSDEGKAYAQSLLHVDPSSIPLAQLAAIRGAMWTARLDVPYGPRPNQSDNILAMDFYQLYDKPTRARMLRYYHDVKGYTHAVTGPLSGTDCYHEQYPCHDASNPGWFPQDGPPSQEQWDFYLDAMQEWWDAGVAPIFFIHPDGWTFEHTRDAFTPLLAQPRAQRLIRIAVGSGWEPAGYEWSSCTWTLYAQWVRATLPNALSLIHTGAKPDGSPYDAPVGTDARCNDNGTPNGRGWARITPYLHGWLIQNGPFRESPAQNPSLAREFGAQFKGDGDGAVFHSPAWHFLNGVAEWPRGSAWGPGIPVRLYNAEVTSYMAYWRNLAEEVSQAWGDLAMASGADGYLDGGTVAVPVR
jgi:hypothetical protein